MSAALNLRRVAIPPVGGPSLTILGRLVLPPRPSAPGVRTRVAVALASEPMRWGVQKVLALAPELQATAVEATGASLTGDDVLAAVRVAPHGVLLLGDGVAGPDAFEVLARVRAEAPRVRVVLVSAARGPEGPLRALALGAMGHLDVGASASAFRDAARQAARGERVVSAVLAEALAEMAAARGEEEDVPGPQVLTPREFQTLRLVARGCSAAEVARELTVSESTVRTYMSALRRKLGLRGTAALVRYALDHGID